MNIITPKRIMEIKGKKYKIKEYPYFILYTNVKDRSDRITYLKRKKENGYMVFN